MCFRHLVHISFFDDKHVHADPASEVVPSAVVQYRERDNPEK